MRVLMGIDLRSDGAEVVARAAPWLSRLGAQADLIYVDEYRDTLTRYLSPALQLYLTQLDAEDHKTLAVLRDALPEAARGECLLKIGKTTDVLREMASGYDLVIVGTHGRTGLSRLWLGSVAESIVRSVPTSVLVLRDREPDLPAKILFAVDMREPSAPLLAALAPWADRLGARVDLLYVEDVPIVFPPSDALLHSAALAAAAARHRIFEEADLGALRDAGLPEAARGAGIVDSGPPVSPIVERSAGYDLVAVGTHARQGLPHAVYGSVAERVVRRAACSVLVLRPPAPKAA